MASDAPFDMDRDLTRDRATSALGILNCLLMLAQEASEVCLPATARAVAAAVRVCEAEKAGRDRAPPRPSAADTTLH